jgi:DNA-directed RNA polymerase subunit RPC12/RpoP
MAQRTIVWALTCNTCDHEWMQSTPDDSDPSTEEVECPVCGSTLLDAVYAGRT